MSNFSEMLVYLRKREGLSQTELAEKLGLSRSAIGMYESGARQPNFEMQEALADIFNVDLDTLMGREHKTRSLPSGFLPMPKMKEWRVIGATACGTPMHKETPWETVEAPEDIKGDVVFRCVGDSMIAARIFDGDLVFVKLKPEIENGQIGVVRIGEEYTLKRLYAYPDYVELRAENPTVQAIILRGKDLEQFEVVGEAVTFLSAVR